VWVEGLDVPGLGLRHFFRLTEPIQDLASLEEAEFLLLYHIKGMNPERVAGMDYDDRLRWMKRLLKEKKAEAKAGKQGLPRD